MRILINASNLKMGGALQVAHSILNEIRVNMDHFFCIVLTSSLAKQININSFRDNFTFYQYNLKPTVINALTGKDRFLSRLENIFKPDCVFSIFGPAYWIPRSPHLMGYAYGHNIYPESPFFLKINRKEKLKYFVLKMIHKHNMKKSKAEYWVETDDARSRLAKLLLINIDKIHVISNTYNSIYNSAILKPNKILPVKKENEFRFVIVSAYYSHKNLEILNCVVPLLKEKGLLNIKFVVTLDYKIYEKVFTKSAKEQIINNGPTTIDDCPQLYSECDAMFLPTLLETFSASYPEAMKMQKPIITSDLPFAHDICGDAALYFNPLDKADIVELIILLINNKSLQSELVDKGNERLKSFFTAGERVVKILHLCEQCSQFEYNRMNA